MSDDINLGGYNKHNGVVMETFCRSCVETAELLDIKQDGIASLLRDYSFQPAPKLQPTKQEQHIAHLTHSYTFQAQQQTFFLLQVIYFTNVRKNLSKTHSSQNKNLELSNKKTIPSSANWLRRRFVQTRESVVVGRQRALANTNILEPAG